MTAIIHTHPTAGNLPIGPQARPQGRPHAKIVTLARVRQRASAAKAQASDDLVLATENLMEQAYQLFSSAADLRDQMADRFGLSRLDDGGAA